MSAGNQVCTDYSSKSEAYFSGVRKDFVAWLPSNSENKILEVGCGLGGTGAFALEERKCSEYIGIEIRGDVAAEAKKKLTRVITADVEELQLDYPSEYFDVLIFSEVLEHLVNPWRTLGVLLSHLKPGGLVLASSPNVSHYRVIADLLLGRWNLTDSGVMDRTHLRWFTPDSFRIMFEDSGCRVEKLESISQLSKKVKIINALTFNSWEHLFIRQICIYAIKKKVS